MSDSPTSNPELLEPPDNLDIAVDLDSGFLTEERFRIDRKKLECMLRVQNGSEDSDENAEAFFQKVMQETSTHILWPSKLKTGAKSKKDPHVKIVGDPESVQIAKQRILQVLDTKKDRVTLKMDVSHSDHSYIIGKGGFKIQQVMEETGCHIHFPDSNRSNTAEKSNQVSIAGQAAWVERARAKIRELLPFEFVFELPSGETLNPREETSPAIQHIQQTYNFNVAFRRSTLGRTLLVVRGCHRLLPRLRQGLALLVKYLTGSKVTHVVGFMKTEVSVHHHQFVMGPGNANVLEIMNKTGATVIFPETENQGLCSAQNGRGKSTVIVQGSFDGVCLAWQELLKCLPLVLLFDLKDGQELDSVIVNKLMESHDINVRVRPKTKDNVKSVLIRGAERDSKVLLQVRKEILGLEEMNPTPTSGRKEMFIRSPATLTDPNDVPRTPNMSTVESLNILSNIIQQNPQIIGLLSNLSNVGPNVRQMEPSNLPVDVGRSKLQDVFNDKGDVQSWVDNTERGYSSSLKNHLQRDLQPNGSDSDSGIFLPTPRIKTFRPPESSASSTCSSDSEWLFRRNVQFGEEPPRRRSAEYEKMLTPTEVMRNSVGETQTPWSGYGLNKSMPELVLGGKPRFSSSDASPFVNRDFQRGSASAANAWTLNQDTAASNDSPLSEVPSQFSFGNLWDTPPQASYGSTTNLEQLLPLLGLEKFKYLFLDHAIDFATFLDLTDVDLQRLNVGFAARRKILAATAAVRRQWLAESPAERYFPTAPGAERTALNFIPPAENSWDLIEPYGV